MSSSFLQEIAEIRRETIAEIVFYINSKPRLYEQFKNLSRDEVKELVYEMADENEGWFGTVYKPMLDELKSMHWRQVVEAL